MAIDNYLDNITSEYRDKPNFINWLSAHLNIIDGLYLCIKSMDNAFDIDFAIGNQLDILGTIIGRNRTLTFQPLNGFNPVLNDDMYRLVLKSKIAMNNWDGTISQMYEIWNNIFPDIGLELVDHQDMSFTAYITGYVNQIRQDLIQHQYIIPKPETVKVNYVGKSDIAFKPYLGMLVGTLATNLINTTWDPINKMNFTSFPFFTIGQIKTVMINCEGGN